MEIPNLPELVLKQKESKIKRYPAHVNRASGLGYFVPELDGCYRRGVYERTKWKDKELHDGRVQMIFDLGNEYEKIILKDLLDADIQLADQQREFFWEDYKVSGHLDGCLLIIENGKTIAVPVEIKSCAPHIFDGLHTFEDFKKYPWTRAYMVQISVYMLMKDMDKAIFLLKNKSTGAMKQIVVGLDYELAEAALKTAETINRHVESQSLPERIKDRDTCGKCPYRHICLPDMKFGNELQIADDPSLETKINRFMDLKESKKEAEKLYKEQISPKLKATAEKSPNRVLNVLLGRWMLTGKFAINGTFRPKIAAVGEEEE